MVEFEEIISGEKPKVQEDTVKNLLSKMETHSENMEFEKAKDVLEEIKTELDKPRTETPWKVQTVKDVYDLIKGDTIRLNPDQIGLSEFLDLTTTVHKRIDELQGGTYADVDRRRKIVAEEMACLGISIPVKKPRVGKKPNRRFLDIAHTIEPDIACRELQRREQTKLWKAIEKGDPDKIKDASEMVRKYSARGRE